VSISAIDRGSAHEDDADTEGVSSIEELNQRILTEQQKIQQRNTRMSPTITDMDKVVTFAVLPSRPRARVHVSGGLCRVDSPSASIKSATPSLISGLNDIAQAMLYLGNEVEAASNSGPHVRLFS